MIAANVVLRRIAPETADEPLLTELITEATAEFGRALNRYLGDPVEVVELYSGGRPAIFLYDDASPDAATLVERRSGIGQAWETVDATEYEFDKSILRHRSCWTRGVANIRVTYSKGYNIGEGPLELRGFVVRMVMARLEEQGLIGTGALKSETIGDHSRAFADTGSWDPTGIEGWQKIAAQWRRQRI